MFIFNIKLTLREKVLLILLALLFVLAIIIFISMAINSKFEDIKLKIQTYSDEQKNLKSLYYEYIQLDSPSDATNYLNKMESEVIRILTKHNVRDKTSNISPQVSKVDNNKYLQKTIKLNFKEVDALSMMKFLRDIEYRVEQPKIKIKSFSFKQSKKNLEVYSFNITLVSFSEN